MTNRNDPEGSTRLRRHLALLHPERPAIALVRGSPGGGALLGDEVSWTEPGSVEAFGFVAAEVGSLAAVLACLGEATPAEGGPVHRLYLAEVMPGAEAPREDAVHWWEGGDDPPGLPAALVEQLRSALDRLAGRVSDDERWPAYARRGGTAALAAALAGEDALAGTAIDARSPTRLWQMKAWSISSVWMNDDVVLKSSLPMWAGEPRVTARLAELVGDTVPRVRAGGSFGDGRPTPWLVQDRVRGTRPSNDLGARARLAATMGSLQRRVRADVDAFETLGAPDRHVGAMAGALHRVWSSVELDRLAEDERERLGELDAWLRARLDALAALEAPRVLVHGDLHGANALVDADDRLVIFDWTDAAVSFPGVDLATVIGFGEDLRDPIWRGVLDAYRTAWGPELGRHGDAVIDLALDLAPAYHALSYEDISRGVPPETRWELAGVVRFLVRRMLDRLPPG